MGFSQATQRGDTLHPHRRSDNYMGPEGVTAVSRTLSSLSALEKLVFQ